MNDTSNITGLHELRQCPFCDSGAQLDEHEGRITSGHYTAQVQCSNCEQVKAPLATEKTKELAKKIAIRNWNSRPDDERIAELVWNGIRECAK